MELTVGIDFGTSNSAVGLAVNGQPWLVDIEEGSKTLPTAVFFDARGNLRLGSAANRALISGDEGRYMRALKSVLGTPLLREARMIGPKRQSLLDVITQFLSELRLRTEAQVRQSVTGVVSGRPVRFHSQNDKANAQALIDLTEAYTRAGFKHIDFLPEPEAAALAAQDLAAGEIGLVVDIGGGTSDFTVFRKSDGKADVLASYGVRLGGTHLDRALSLDHVMPLFGAGTQVRRALADGLLPVPATLFNDLATWQKIPFLYTKDTERLVKDLQRHAVEPDKLARLFEVIEAELGHDVAFAVEAGKIAVNTDGQGVIELGLVEKGLSASLDEVSMSASLARFKTELSEATTETLKLAGVKADAIGAVVYVGGTSLMSIVPDAIKDVIPNARSIKSEAFTAVVDGLAIAAGQKQLAQSA
ncbi:Hsp70 family protein [Pacificibacter marinus]|uniref:Chaperone protein DnaK n=1 Tax=Pacificibacter marinus TaxID=658057 RepID=A0A1Y5SGB1_9RHOB|nr:Hsp70 family protein [Pacificibacter marinus]SEK52347.1 hypothetical chaperone protein [Pacificibacter marinus]SLN38428.1 Chaperone protein DnaK [Pacificibacter marinus]